MSDETTIVKRTIALTCLLQLSLCTHDRFLVSNHLCCILVSPLPAQNISTRTSFHVRHESLFPCCAVYNPKTNGGEVVKNCVVITFLEFIELEYMGEEARRGSIGSLSLIRSGADASGLSSLSAQQPNHQLDRTYEATLTAPIV